MIACSSSSPARLPSSVGGRRSESFTARERAQPLPADCSDGMPSTPVTDSAGRQVRLSTSSVRSSAIGVMPSRNGNLSNTAVSRTRAASCACAMRPAALRRACHRSGSGRSSRPRSAKAASAGCGNSTARRPRPSPECTPSCSTRTVRLPPARPRSEVVHRAARSCRSPRPGRRPATACRCAGARWST